MLQASLRDGSKVIVQHNKEPQNGDIVVTRIDDETTVKYFYKYDDSIVLRPANRAYHELRYDKANDIKIRGVVIGVLW